MRTLLRILLCLGLSALICGGAFAADKITVDPNAGAPVPPKTLAESDARLAQKVTYEARFKAVRLILEDLTEMAGIKLSAGSGKSDWPVRARKMNIFVKDIKLSDLMESIARTMKFRWSRNDEVKPPTYRLVVDRAAAAAADKLKAAGEQKREAYLRKQRADWVEIIMRDGGKSPSEVEATRDTDPVFYRYARAGALRSFRALFEEVPETKDRFLAGQGFRISAGRLSENTRSLLFNAGNEFAKFLQMGREPVTGFEPTLTLHDEYDIAFFRLDVDSFTPNLRWGSFSENSVGYFHIYQGISDLEIAVLRDKDSEWTRALCENENRAIDVSGDRSASLSLLEANVPQLTAEKKKEEETLCPSEPLNEHPVSPELDKTVKLKVEIPKTKQNPVRATNTYVVSCQKAIADATGLGVVSDSWANIQGGRLTEQEAKLSELLDKFSTEFNYNWSIASGIMEFRHRKWWKNRLNQIPDEWVAAWSENTSKNRILSLDDLAAISALTYEQAEESLRPDKVLGELGIYDDIVRTLDNNGNVHWLRLFSMLSPQLRALLFTDNGVNGQMLTQDQWKQAQMMLGRIGSSRGDATFVMVAVPGEEPPAYKFKTIDRDMGKIDNRWVLNLPTYVPPPSQDGAKQ